MRTILFYIGLLLFQNIATDSSNQDGSLHHNGITVNFDTEDCELGICINICFHLSLSFKLTGRNNMKNFQKKY